VPVDRQLIAQTVKDLRVVLPEADDLLAGLHRWPKPPRRILEVDGAGLTLVQEDGRPRWVAATDAAMELLQQIQHEAPDAWPVFNPDSGSRHWDGDGRWPPWSRPAIAHQ